MTHRRYVCLLAAIASSAVVLSTACTIPAPELAAPGPVSASEGVSYVSLSGQEREEIRVQANRSVSWIRERVSADGLSTSVELRWTARTPVVSALSDVMYELTHRPLGAIGIRDGADRWRALRIAAGGSVAALQLPSSRTQVFAALEQTLMDSLRLGDRKYLVPLPIDASAEAVARCHATDRAPFRVVAAADADNLDYHESIDDTSGKVCASKALSSLRQAMHQAGSGRHAEGVMHRGGRIDVRRGAPSPHATRAAWPEVPLLPSNEPAPAQVLYRFEAPSRPPRAPSFSRLPEAAPATGELIALRLRVSLIANRRRPPPHGWGGGSVSTYASTGSDSGQAWRITIRSDYSAEIAWQRWHNDFSAAEVTFETRPDPALIDAAFSLARSLRLNHRTHWYCGETNLYVLTDAEDSGDDESAGSRKRIQWPECARISGIVKHMQHSFVPELLGAQLEEAVKPMVVGSRDCRANSRTAVRAVLELASPTAAPRLEAMDPSGKANASAAELDCARTAVSGFSAPPAVRALWGAGRLRAVVMASRWDLDFHTGQLAELGAPRASPEEVARVSYRTRW